jgi:hypothetical protein
MVGGARPPPFTTFTLTSKVAVYAPAKWADTLTLFHLYQYMYSVFHSTPAKPSAPVVTKVVQHDLIWLNKKCSFSHFRENLFSVSLKVAYKNIQTRQKPQKEKCFF